MALTFNTLVLDLSVALQTVRDYQSGNFQRAIDNLQLVLDCEPANWDARLMLAACYYKSGQFFLALRAFQYIYDKTTNLDVRQKALEGVQVTSMKLERRLDNRGIPAEFGCYAEVFGQKQAPPLGWM